MDIEFVNVQKKYNVDEKEVFIFKDLNFKLAKEKITIIYGENGSGKSTLGLMLTAFIKPSEGYIKFDDFKFDNKTKKRKLKSIRDKVKIVFQDVNLQIFKSTIKDEVAFSFNRFFKSEKMNLEERDKFLDEKLSTLFKILSFPQEYKERSPYRLSGGEKRKLIVGCLLLTPTTEVLVLDEPSAGLDARTRREFVKFIKDINEQFHTTILIISHDNELINSFDIKISIKDLKN